jgi:hypothetical protein
MLKFGRRGSNLHAIGTELAIGLPRLSLAEAICPSMLPTMSVRSSGV